MLKHRLIQMMLHRSLYIYGLIANDVTQAVELSLVPNDITYTYIKWIFNVKTQVYS